MLFRYRLEYRSDWMGNMSQASDSDPEANAVFTATFRPVSASVSTASGALLAP